MGRLGVLTDTGDTVVLATTLDLMELLRGGGRTLTDHTFMSSRRKRNLRRRRRRSRRWNLNRRRHVDENGREGKENW